MSFSRMPPGESLKAMEQFVLDKLAAAFPAQDTKESKAEESLYPSGASARQVSGTIFKGVTEAIFESYRRAHPDMTEAEFDHFASEVQKGIGMGVQESREALGATESLSEEVADVIDETENLVNTRLNDWFAETRSQMFGAQAE